MECATRHFVTHRSIAGQKSVKHTRAVKPALEEWLEWPATEPQWPPFSPKTSPDFTPNCGVIAELWPPPFNDLYCYRPPTAAVRPWPRTQHDQTLDGVGNPV